MKTPSRLRDRFKRSAEVTAKKKKTKKKKARKLSRERYQERQPKPLEYVNVEAILGQMKEGENGHPSICTVGTRVRVTNAWRGYNSRFVGKIGYVVARLPFGASFDVTVKFARTKKKKVTVGELGSLPGAVGSFRSTELELVK